MYITSHVAITATLPLAQDLLLQQLNVDVSCDSSLLSLLLVNLEAQRLPDNFFFFFAFWVFIRWVKIFVVYDDTQFQWK